MSESPEPSSEQDELISNHSDALSYPSSESETLFPLTSAEILASGKLKADSDIELISNPPSPRPPVAKKKAAKKSSNKGKTLMYNVTVIPVSEVNKERKKQAKLNTYMKLTSITMMEEYKHMFLEKISARLERQDIILDDYSIFFTISCISTAPLPVHSSEDYQNMVECAVGAWSDTVMINLDVTERVHVMEKKWKKHGQVKQQGNSDKAECTKKS